MGNDNAAAVLEAVTPLHAELKEVSSEAAFQKQLSNVLGVAKALAEAKLMKERRERVSLESTPQQTSNT